MMLQHSFVIILFLGSVCDGQVLPRYLKLLHPGRKNSNMLPLIQPVPQVIQDQPWHGIQVPSENSFLQEVPMLRIPERLPSVHAVPVLQFPQQTSTVELPSKVAFQDSKAHPFFQLSQGAQQPAQVSRAHPAFWVSQGPQEPTWVSRACPDLQAPVYLKSESLQVSRPAGVKVECRENSILVEVQQDMMGTGQLIQPSEVMLGGCPSTGQDYSAGVLKFESELHGCGSTLMVTDDLVYTFHLMYVPKPIGASPIVRTNGAVVTIACHYLRKHNVSSNAVVPTWVPYMGIKAVEEHLGFTLKLMTDDWQVERASNIYFLGDILNIEASVIVANHQPLRVFVDSCVATLEPDVTSTPRYAFVQNHGCLTDAKLTGSHSQFLPRRQEHKLQMQLNAFRFAEETRNSIYIACILKAMAASMGTDAQHKACSFFAESNGWKAADGNHEVCGCCDRTCPLKGRGVAALKGKAEIGPIIVGETQQVANKQMLVPQKNPWKLSDGVW